MEPDDDKTQSQVPLANGTMISHYRIVEKIGAGGMDEVYQPRTDRIRKFAHGAVNPGCVY